MVMVFVWAPPKVHVCLLRISKEKKYALSKRTKIKRRHTSFRHFLTKHYYRATRTCSTSSHEIVMFVKLKRQYTPLKTAILRAQNSAQIHQQHHYVTSMHRYSVPRVSFRASRLASASAQCPSSKPNFF